jgi:AcrR family transcriptional regulator
MPQRLTREEQQQQTRERLLAAATELFTERGVNGASVEVIAERAGYSRGAFYSNYADKHELVLALLERRTYQEADEVGAMVRSDAPYPERMDALRSWHRVRAEHMSSWLMLRTELWMHALRSEDPALRERLAQRDYFARGALAEGLAPAFTGTGTTPPADLAFLGLILHALEDGLLIQRLIAPEGTRDEVVVDAVDLLIRSWIALARQNAAIGVTSANTDARL